MRLNGRPSGVVNCCSCSRMASSSPNCGSSGVVHTYKMVSFGARRARVSMWLSVSSPSSAPWSSHSTFSAPSQQRSRCSISSRLRSPFRLGDSRHSDVVRITPLPSLSIEPPSSTKPRRLQYEPPSSPASYIRRVMRLSRLAANLSPQALNLKSFTITSPLQPTVLMGP